MRATGALLATALATVGIRMSARPQLAPPELPRVRAPLERPVDRPCLQEPEVEQDLALLRREVRLLEAERTGLDARRRLLGSALPDDLPPEVRPDAVARVAAELAPEGADLVWQCASIPCAGVLILAGTEPSDLADAHAFHEGLSEVYPGAALDPLYLDDDGATARDGEEVALVVPFTVRPELSEPEHRARLYFLSLSHRKRVLEDVRQLLLESAL